jgi:hypothetical protein
MNERDRMLAEGPRVAPEPPTADGSVLTSTPTPTPSPAKTTPQDRAKKMPRGLMRLFPLALFGLVLAANAGAGKHALWVIVPIAVSAILFRFIRKRSE